MRHFKSFALMILLLAFGIMLWYRIPAHAATKLQDSDVTLSQNSYVYDGTEKKPDVTVKSGGTALTVNTDYTVSYANCQNAGTATVTVTGTGAYEGTVTLSYTIAKAQQTLSLSKTEASIGIGKTYKVSCSGNQGALSYSSGRPGTASVSATGLITGKHAGYSYITVSAAGTANYESASARFTITVNPYKMTSSNTTVTLSKKSYVFNGKKKSPKVTVKYGKKTLKKGRDYKVTYKNNINAGKATARITGTGDYSGKFNRYYTIKKMTRKMKVTLKSKKVRVLGRRVIKTNIHHQFVSFKSANKKIAKVSKNGTITGVHPGTVKITVYVRETKNYVAAKQVITIKVVRIPLNKKYYEVTIPKEAYLYTGRHKKPKVTVTGPNGVLTLNRHYTVTYKDNVDAGTATIQVKGKGDYTGTLIKTFEIKKAKQTIYARISSGTLRVNGKAKIAVTKKGGTISYKSSDTGILSVTKGGVVRGKSPGTATITVRAAESKNYYAAKTTLIVKVRRSSLKEAKLKVTITPLYASYTGDPIYPKVKITDNGYKLSEGTDYTLTYKYNVNIGTAVLSIKGYGNYYGTVNKNFFINPKKTKIRLITKKSDGSVALSWTEKSDITGYQIQYATNEDFVKAKLIRVKDPEQTSYTIKGLSSGSKYYIRLRTYKYIPDDDETYVSDWSAVETVK